MTSDAPTTAPAEPRELRGRFADEVVLVTGFPAARARAVVRVLAEREPKAELWLVVPPQELESAARVLADSKLPRAQLRLIPGGVVLALRKKS